MLLLIDGDIVLFQAIAAAQQELEFEDDLFTLHTNLADARDAVVSLLGTMTTGYDKFILCLSDPKVNWRKSVYPDYKSNRKTVRKPLGYYELRAWAENRYDTVSKPSLEADDILGILATKPGNNAAIWSIDKDLMQIPGNHYDPDTGLNTVVSLRDADRWHLMQTLTGDVTDGYPGCPGVGPKKAEKIVGMSNADLHMTDALVSDVWPGIVGAYENAGLTEADALVQARIARICRWTDWDKDDQKVKLWSPY